MSENPREPLSPAGKIEPEDALKGFRALHPAFEACWHEAVKEDEGEDEKMAPHWVYGAFAHALEDILIQDPTRNCAPITQYVETLMRDGTKEVRDTVAVYFIEALLAIADRQRELMKPVLQLLGPLTRDYALGWNEFLGCQNKGLEK